MPYDWLPDLPVYVLGQGSFVVDDTSVDYSSEDANGFSPPVGRAMDGSGPPSPLDGGGDGTNSSGGGSSSYVFSTNGLWIQWNGLTNPNH